MVVQIAFLAERLWAEGAEHLQSQVLGSIVAVQIPPEGKQLDDDIFFKVNFAFLGAITPHLALAYL